MIVLVCVTVSVTAPPRSSWLPAVCHRFCRFLILTLFYSSGSSMWRHASGSGLFSDRQWRFTTETANPDDSRCNRETPHLSRTRRTLLICIFEGATHSIQITLQITFSHFSPVCKIMNKENNFNNIIITMWKRIIVLGRFKIQLQYYTWINRNELARASWDAKEELQ